MLVGSMESSGSRPQLGLVGLGVGGGGGPVAGREMRVLPSQMGGHSAILIAYRTTTSSRLDFMNFCGGSYNVEDLLQSWAVLVGMVAGEEGL